METQISPLVSVIMPVHNGGDYLASAIQSVLAQTEDKLELLAIDDGSSDDSFNTLKKFQKLDQRVTALKNDQNLGVSTTRNRGLALAKGQYIALMDCDDICMPDRLEAQISKIQQDKLDVCGSSLRYFGEKEQLKPYPDNDAQIKLNLFCDAASVATPSVIFRKEILNGINFDSHLSFGEDLVFYLRLAIEKQARFGNCNIPLVKYRIHPTQASKRLLERKHHLFTEVFFDLAKPYGLDFALSDFALHYELIKKRKALNKEMVNHYRQFLLKLTQLLAIDNTANQERWEDFCTKRLKKAKPVSALYKSLPSPKTSVYIRLYTEGLLSNLLARR